MSCQEMSIETSVLQCVCLQAYTRTVSESLRVSKPCQSSAAGPVITIFHVCHVSSVIQLNISRHLHTEKHPIFTFHSRTAAVQPLGPLGVQRRRRSGAALERAGGAGRWTLAGCCGAGPSNLLIPRWKHPSMKGALISSTIPGQGTPGFPSPI